MEGFTENTGCHCDAFACALANWYGYLLDLLYSRVLLLVERSGIELHLLALTSRSVKLASECFREWSCGSCLQLPRIDAH